MPVSILCTHCAASLRVPETALGKTGRCPRCQNQFRAELPPAPADDSDLVDDEPNVVETDPPSGAEADAPKKKKKKRKKKAGGLFGLPPGAAVRIGLVLGALLCFVVPGVVVVRVLMSVAAPADVPESQWKACQVGTASIDFPGTPTRQQQTTAGISMVMHMYQPDKNSVYIAGYTLTALSPERAALPPEQLLDDACDGSLANMQSMGARQVRRESIQLGPYPGKQMVMYMSRGSGHAISRCYLANGSLYIAMCGGRGFEAGQKNVTRFLDSLKIPDAPPKPGGAEAGTP